MIKYETTQIAAADLKKYYGALDKVSLFALSCVLAYVCISLFSRFNTLSFEHVANFVGSYAIPQRQDR
jgi:hypothetical protein